MSDLGPEARALVEAGRRLDGPPPGAKARVAESLQAKIAAGAAGSAASASAGSAPWIGGAAALGVAAAAVVLWPSPTQEGRRLVEPERRSSAFENVRLRPPEDPVVETPAPTTAPSRPAAVLADEEHGVLAEPEASSSDLLAEARLMADAQRFLRDGAWSEALKMAETHQRRFPEGILLEERLGVMALAQCALGLRESGRELGARIQSQNPSSPLLDRIRERCR
ncbi:MAG: hypothetical protein AAGD10_18155 [Myxococcota bacterium]